MDNKNEVISHYDALIDEKNDAFYDPPLLKKYMDGWDGKTFFEILKLDKTKSVLEIGVGTGRLAEKAACVCKEFCGIDISPKTAKRACHNLSNLSNVSIVTGDFCEYRFERQFDVIYSSLTFMHIKNKENAIMLAANLLLPGGRIVLSLDKNTSDYIDYGTRKIKIFPDNPEEIKLYMQKAGLSVTCEQDVEQAVIIAAERRN